MSTDIKLPEPYLSAGVVSSLLGPNVTEALYTADQLRAALAQRTDEPVAWRVRRSDTPAAYWILFLHEPVDAMKDPEREVQPLDTAAPAAPAYVPLSVEDINECFESVMFDSDVEPTRELIGRAIESLVVARMRGEGK